MALNLLDSFGKKGINYGLAARAADVVDTDFLSKYFIISDFDPTLSAGKNSFSFNGSSYLKPSSEILIECIDSQGNPLFVEMATYSDVAAQTYAYREATAWVFAIHVFNDTADGIGKLTLYGVLANNKTVKWSRNVTIDKTQRNDSKVRFYLTPKLEIASVLVPVIDPTIATSSIITKNLTGQLHGLAVTPPADTNLPTINKRNIDVDYRLVIDTPTGSRSSSEISMCNSQMAGATVNLILHKIKKPFAFEDITPTNITGTFTIDSVLNQSSFQVTEPYFYKDTYNNSAVTNIISASYNIAYPFVTYNNATTSYQKTTIGSQTYVVQRSYADITYRNIRTFSGYVARHKIYRKSLLANADFSIIADEPITINEILRDSLTQNKYYELIGKFYNDEHIARYWFTSSNNLQLIHTPDIAVDSMMIYSPTPGVLTGNDYIMVKNDSVTSNRNASYVPFDMTQFTSTSGSAYDSNFMAFKANVQYIFQISTTIQKDQSETDAGLAFYLTSSVANARLEQAYTNNYGLKVAELESVTSGISSENFDDQIFFFTPKNDIYGTLVIVPYRCNAVIKNISFRVYGDDGFSPDVFTARIPWTVAVANESFEVKAELFDINSNLIYSDLKVLQSFDPSGSSLIPYIPGSGATPSVGDLFVSGNLYVSHSATIQYGDVNVNYGDVVLQQGNVYIPNIPVRPYAPPASASRFISVRHDAGGILAENPVVDLAADTEYIHLTLGNLPGDPTIASNVVTTRRSMSTQFDANAGRRVYWSAGVKIVESGSYS